MAVRFAGAVSLFEVDPDLIEHVDSRQAAIASSRAIARVRTLRPGDRDPWSFIESPNRHLGLLVIDGLLTCNITLLGRTTMELIGGGDVLRPWDDAAERPSIPLTLGWTVHAPTQWLENHLAILENPRVDVRLLLLFWQLADRWGTVGPEGVTVPLRLTHNTLGRLVRAQRPSVTASLHEMARRRVVDRRRDGTWLLLGEPSRQLQLLLDGSGRDAAASR
jgi:CRP/FNR family transcriptional regulator, cyclic AMP receptor protein